MEKEEFVKLLEKTFIEEIFRAERSYFLYRQIVESGKKIDQFNKSQYTELFRHFIKVLDRDVFLSVARMYDKASNIYPTLCFEDILNKTLEFADTFPQVSEKKFFLKQLQLSGFKDAEELAYGKHTPGEIVTSLVNHFKLELESDKYKEKIALLKNLRDKKIAHNENVLITEYLSWEELLELIELTKNFIGVFGWVFSIVYKHDEEYILTRDSERVSISMKHLMEDIGIIEVKP